MKKYFPALGLSALILVLWQSTVKIMGIESFILPAPSQILKELVAAYALLVPHSLQTFGEAVFGFALAIFAGTVIAVLMGLLPVVKKAFYPLVVISQTIPIVTIAPLLIIWFGVGVLPKIMVVALVCFFPITVSLIEGIDNIEPDMVKMMLAMGASPWQIFTKIKLPGALPSFFAGLKISATYSIMGAVIGEWLGASRGLGVFMTRSMHSFLTARVFAAVIVISVLSLIFVGFMEILSRYMMPWYYQKKPWLE